MYENTGGHGSYMPPLPTPIMLTVNVVYKVAASGAQLANCILLHVYGIDVQ